MFGIARGRLVLYALAVVALSGLNAMRYLGGEDPAPGPADAPGAAPLELGELVFGRADGDGGEPARDLFRRVEEAPVVAPPPPPPPPPAPADPRAERIAEANRRLDAIAVVGIFGAGDDMIAVLSREGDVDNVEAGDPLFSGFVVREITMTGILVESEALGIRRTLELGGN